LSGLRFGAITIGKIGYVMTCLAASVLLVVSGYAHRVLGQTNLIGQGVTIKNSPSVGAMNILVMGLESRTDYEGQCLSSQLLTAMHAGKTASCLDKTVGSQDTNTLILVHIFDGGQKAVGFSIPRDSLVQFPQTYLGYSEGKIDAAYNWAYTQYINTNFGKESHHDLYLHANQAGQQATLDTVQAVTGQHIDHFVEVNLAGFYYLAQAFNGIEVCIKPAGAQGGFKAGANLTDFDPLVYPHTDNSGFNAYHDGYNAKKGGKQYLHLSAPQALAYVRSRDTLPGVDVGRTYRQQATLDYVIWKLKHDGVLNDFGTLNSLLDTASHYLITDGGWNLPDFATNMRALTGSHMSFTTLPGAAVNGVSIPGYPNPQDIYKVDVPTIQRDVKAAFAGQAVPASKGSKKKGPAALPPKAVTVDVYNGNPLAGGLAGRDSAALVALGYKAGAVKNSADQTQPVQPGNQVFYGKGAAVNATEIAAQFGTTAKPLATLPADHVEVLIGSTVTTVPPGLVPSSSPSASTQSVSARVFGSLATVLNASTPSPSATSTAGAGAGGLGGGALTVAPNAPYGVPCVW
jgi:anionic cell wall polymer biosynthesis LytR-Cps2A-Psr (LCP) family protein